MKRESPDLQYSKKGKRVISDFVTQELLYDYVVNKLDRERTKAVEAQLENSKELKADLEKIKNGLRYARSLSKIGASDEIVQKIQVPTSYIDVILAKANFDKWPQGLKWGLESLAVAIAITIIAIAVPWEKALKINFSQRSSYVIAELKNDHENKTEAPVEKGATLYPDENKPVEPVAKLEESKPSQEGTKPINVEVPQVASSPIANPKQIPPVTPTPVETKTNLVAAKGATTNTTKKEVGTGFLYRGVLHTSNVPVITPKLIEEVTKLGGRKAGEVELGWKKGTGSYFHFTMPQSKYEDLNKTLATYGKLKLQKENHERVMPDGIIRLIILVEEVGKK